MSNAVRSFAVGKEKIPEIIASLNSWLAGDGFSCQTVPAEGGATLFQAQKTGFLRTIAGMRTTLNVVFRPVAESINVEIGEGAWVDEAVTGVVGAVVFFPIAITSGIGLYLQAKLPDRVFAHIDNFILGSK